MGFLFLWSDTGRPVKRAPDFLGPPPRLPWKLPELCLDRGPGRSCSTSWRVPQQHEETRGVSSSSTGSLPSSPGASCVCPSPFGPAQVVPTLVSRESESLRGRGREGGLRSVVRLAEREAGWPCFSSAIPLGTFAGAPNARWGPSLRRKCGEEEEWGQEFLARAGGKSGASAVPTHPLTHPAGVLQGPGIPSGGGVPQERRGIVFLASWHGYYAKSTHRCYSHTQGCREGGAWLCQGKGKL